MWIESGAEHVFPNMYITEQVVEAQGIVELLLVYFSSGYG
jgi:hypothetical protein